MIRELDLLIEVCGHCESAPGLVGLEGINLEYTNEVEWNCDRTNELHISEASAEENADYPALLCLDGGGVTTVCGTSVQGVASPITIDCGDCEADNPASWRALASGVCQGFTLEYTPDCIYQTVETYKCCGDDEPWVLDVAGNSSPQSVSLSHGDLTYRNPAAWQCLRANLMVLDDDDESGCSVAADTPRYICLVPGETDLSAECFPVCEAVAQRYQLTISGVQNTEHCDNCQGSNGTWLLEDPQRFPFNPCWWEADLPFACNRCLGNPPPEPNPSDPSPHAVFRFGSFGASGNAEVIISTSSYTNSFGCSGCTEAIYRGQANCLGTMVLNRFAAGLLPCSPGPLYPQSCVWPSSVTVTAIP